MHAWDYFGVGFQALFFPSPLFRFHPPTKTKQHVTRHPRNGPETLPMNDVGITSMTVTNLSMSSMLLTVSNYDYEGVTSIPPGTHGRNLDREMDRVKSHMCKSYLLTATHIE